MSQNSRKLLGVVLILGSLVAWSILATWLYLSALQGAAGWALILYFAAAGILWFVPAAWIIRWMSRPDG